MCKQKRKQGVRLCFQVEHFKDTLAKSIKAHASIVQTPDRVSVFKFKWTSTPATLEDTLRDVSHKLYAKKQLTLTLAYGVLTLAESPWLDPRWRKQHISFFKSSNDKIWLAQPFITSEMKPADTRDAMPLEVMHLLPSILSLGVLLLELETGRLIESMRTDDDYLDPVSKEVDGNIDFTAAVREAEATPISSPVYKEALLACLSAEIWNRGYGQESKLSDESIRKILYEQVIEKLDADLDILNAKI